MNYKCLSCKKNYSNRIDAELKKRFKNTLKFSNNDINKFHTKEQVFICMSI